MIVGFTIGGAQLPQWIDAEYVAAVSLFQCNISGFVDIEIQLTCSAKPIILREQNINIARELSQAIRDAKEKGVKE